MTLCFFTIYFQYMEFFSKSIADITGLNIWLFPAGESSIQHISGSENLAAMKNELNIAALQYMHHNNDPALLFTDIHNLSYVHGEFEEGTVLCGPFLNEEHQVSNELRNKTVMMLVPTLSKDEIQAIGQLIRIFANQRGLKVQTTIPQIDHMVTHNPAHDDLNRINKEVIEESYKKERKLRILVSGGDIEGLKQFLKSFLPTKTMIHAMPINPLRQSKNGSIILNTILRLSAEKGGMIPIMLHGMSSEFARRIERARSEEELKNLRDEMCLAYCDAVNKFSIANHSLIVKKTSEYIMTHLNEKLSLSDLADFVSCSATYLARQFRKEQGMSVGEFIRSKKIDEAKYLLANTQESLAEISLKLGFEDMGYFTRVFRKTTGNPPSVYRNRIEAEIDSSLPI